MNCLHHAQNHERTGDGYWKSFEAFLDATASSSRRKGVDARLGSAANYFSRLAFKEAADKIRAGQIDEGLALVPSYKRVGEVMEGRRKLAKLETHHTATKDWTRRLIPGITDAQLDDMPALLLNKYFHNKYDTNLPEGSQFHKILREEMAMVGRTREGILQGLENTYKRFEGLDVEDAAPDAWIVTREWLRQRGVQ